jgi:hypothetical protein
VLIEREGCTLATSPADAVLAPTPDVGHHEFVWLLLGLLAVAVLFVATQVLFEQADNGSPSRTTSRTTVVTYMPAPAPQRLGPARPEFLR